MFFLISFLKKFYTLSEHDKYKKYTFWFTVILAVAASISAYFAYQTFTTQFDYYKSVTRPFVGVDSVRVLKTSHKDSIEVEATIKNVGTIPSKKISTIWIFSVGIDSLLLYGEIDDIKQYLIQKYGAKRNEKAATVIYPNKFNKIYFYGSFLPLYQPKQEFLKTTSSRPFLHFIIFYSDMKGNEYFYMGVFELDLRELEFKNTIQPTNFD